VLYDISLASPTSQAMITVRLTDGKAETHQVTIANEIRQERPQPGPCTTRDQPSNSVRIGPSGFDPTELRPSLGMCVAFVNQDTVPHDIRSDPHPAHSNCPSMNVGLVPSGTARVSLAMTTWGTCGYHDERAPDDERFKGRFVIDAPR
jgi:plastocyanin